MKVIRSVWVRGIMLVLSERDHFGRGEKDHMVIGGERDQAGCGGDGSY